MVIYKEALTIHEATQEQTELYTKLIQLQRTITHTSSKKERAVWIRIEKDMDELLKELIRLKAIDSASGLIRSLLQQYIANLDFSLLVV